MNAVDTNILIYAVDLKEQVKQPKAEKLLQHLVAGPATTVVFWQVLVEAVQQLRRWHDQGWLTEVQFGQHVQTFRAMFPLVFPTAGVLDHALNLAKRYSLSHWDSMILGACQDAGVTVLYTEDIGAPRTIDQIQLLNPLV
jgi:predicted nucleic acid-binding protein